VRGHSWYDLIHPDDVLTAGRKHSSRELARFDVEFDYVVYCGCVMHTGVVRGRCGDSDVFARCPLRKVLKLLTIDDIISKNHVQSFQWTDVTEPRVI